VSFVPSNLRDKPAASFDNNESERSDEREYRRSAFYASDLRKRPAKLWYDGVAIPI
jgi:hypothetical protein